MLCNASGCKAGRDKVSPTLIDEGNFDTRLSSQVCDRLAEIEKESWEDYRYQKHQLIKKALGLVEELAEKKSLRVVKRSGEEQTQAEERHSDVVENF